jgi:hypothetical protein
VPQSTARRRTCQLETLRTQFAQAQGLPFADAALPGCVSQGDTCEDALKNVQEAIAVYLDHCRARGDEPPREVDNELL